MNADVPLASASAPVLPGLLNYLQACNLSSVRQVRDILCLAAQRGYLHLPAGSYEAVARWQLWCRWHRYPPVILRPRRVYAGLSVNLKAAGIRLSTVGEVEVLHLLATVDRRRCRRSAGGLYFASSVPIADAPAAACALVDLCLEHAVSNHQL